MRSGTLDKAPGCLPPALPWSRHRPPMMQPASPTTKPGRTHGPAAVPGSRRTGGRLGDQHAALEQAGGDVRVAQSQLDAARRSAEQCALQADESARKAAEFFAAQPLLEAPSRQRLAALGGSAEPGQSRCAGRKSQPRLAEELAPELAARLEPAQQQYNQRYACSFALGVQIAGPVPHRVRQPGAHRLRSGAAARLEQAQRDCRDRFRKDVFYRMKDDISSARRQFRELNRVMEQLCYGEEVYRFELRPGRDAPAGLLLSGDRGQGQPADDPGGLAGQPGCHRRPAVRAAGGCADGKDHDRRGRKRPGTPGRTAPAKPPL